MLLYRFLLKKMDELRIDTNKNAAVGFLVTTLIDAEFFGERTSARESKGQLILTLDWQHDWLTGDEGRRIWQRNCSALRWLAEHFGKAGCKLPADVRAALDDTIGRARPLIDDEILTPGQGMLRLQVLRADGQPAKSSDGWTLFDDLQVLWSCAYASLLFPGATTAPGRCAYCGQAIQNTKKKKPSGKSLCDKCRPAVWKIKNPRKLAKSRLREKQARETARRKRQRGK
jgi:hypothetical protein